MRPAAPPAQNSGRCGPRHSAHARNESICEYPLLCMRPAALPAQNSGRYGPRHSAHARNEKYLRLIAVVYFLHSAHARNENICD